MEDKVVSKHMSMRDELLAITSRLERLEVNLNDLLDRVLQLESFLAREVGVETDAWRERNSPQETTRRF